MVSIGGAKQVINLFVHNPKQLLVTKPKVIQMCAEDIATKLKYAPLEGDVMSLSPQARKAAERIKELKSRVLENSYGERMTYDEFMAAMSKSSEDMKLAYWYEMTKGSVLSKSQKTCIKEVTKCFKKNNLRKIEFFKNLSDDEIQLLSESKGIDRQQLLAVISGHKPAYFDSSEEGIINFAKGIKGTKYEKDFLAINFKSNPKQFCILNKKQVKEIVENNKEIFCRELGLNTSTPANEVYQKWLSYIEQESPVAKPIALGLTLGYPRYSNIIWTLQEGILRSNKKLNDIWGVYGGVVNEKSREALLAAIRHKDSPFRNYSEEFKKDFEHYVSTEDFRKFMNPFDERFYSSFKLYGSDSVDMKKIVENEVDFVNNFRMEQLF